jgi:hypothetical protein
MPTGFKFRATYKNLIITSCNSLISSFERTKHLINAPFLSKDSNHIGNFESFPLKMTSNYNNRKKLHILSGFRQNSSQKTSKRCVSHVFEQLNMFQSFFYYQVPKIITVFCVHCKVALDEDSHI